MSQRIALTLSVILAVGGLLIAGRTAPPLRPVDRMAILASGADLAQVETQIRRTAAARDILVDDRSGGAVNALDWQLVKDGKLRIAAVYDAYHSVVEICFFEPGGKDFITDFKDALRRSLAGT
jgi:hypothetical protein